MPTPIDVNKAAALAAGEKLYWPAKPCHKGHVCQKRIVGKRQMGACLMCHAEWVSSDRFKQINRNKRRLERAADRVGMKQRDYASRTRIRETNPEHYKATKQRHEKANRQKHPKQKLAYRKARECAKIQRTPAWADLAAIKAFYEACPAGYEVDHVYPLRGKLCSGLHVLANLQYLPAAENRAKGNRMPDERRAVPPRGHAEPHGSVGDHHAG